MNLKVRKNGRPTQVAQVIRRTDLPHVGNEVVRIINECDPIGFLSDIVNGKAIQCHIVGKDGTVVTIYETPSLAQRISTARFLTDRYMPKVGIIKHDHLHKIVKEEGSQGKADTRRNFEQIVEHAASKSE